MRDEIIARLRRGENAAAIVAGARACAQAFFGVAPPMLEAPAVAPRATSLPATTPGRRRGVPALFLGLGSALGLAVFGGAGWLVARAIGRRRRRRCRQCRFTMVRLDEVADDAHLAPGEAAEERLGSVDYDVWTCPGCGAVEKLRYGRWFTRYARCPQCSHVTTATAERTLRTATTFSTGLMEVHERCEHCGRQHAFTKTIPRVTPSSGSSGASSRSSGGGGGRSSGRGSSGRW